MERLLQETNIGCPGATDIWRGIRATAQTGEALYPDITSINVVEVVQRKAVWKSIDDRLAELRKAGL